MTDMLPSSDSSCTRLPKDLTCSPVRWLQRAFLAASLTIGLSGAAHSQAEFPSRGISVIVPFAVGGATDGSIRILAEALGPILGVRVIVENKPGASNQIGVNYFLGQPADGYTVLAGTTGIAVLRLVNKAFALDLRKELAGISGVGENSLVVAISSKLPIQNLQEFIKYGKDNPGKLNYGSQGAIDVLASSALIMALGINAVTVRYGGGGPVKTALLANDIQFSSFFAGDIAPLLSAGYARAIATTGSRRHADHPDLPTVQELTRTNYEFIAWVGLFAKTGTPGPVVEKINLAVQRALRNPEVRKRLKTLGYEVSDMGPAAFSRFFTDEINKWTKVAKETKFQPE